MSAVTSCRFRNSPKWSDWRAAKPALPKTKVRLETRMVAVIANGLGPLSVLKSATSGAVLDELRDGPLDKHGGGSRILDVDAKVHEDEIARLAGFGKDYKDPAGGVERGLTAKEIDTFMKANLKRDGDAARWYYPMLMKGEWPVLLKILGKGEGDERYLSVAEVRTLFVEKRLPERITARLPKPRPEDNYRRPVQPATHSLRLRPVARNPFFMLGQVVLNRPPGRTRRRKYVQARPNLGIVVEQTSGDTDRLQITCLAWRQAAAHLATIAETAGRGFIAHGHVLAGQKSELVNFDMSVCCECRAGKLAAIGTMAVCDRSHFIDFKPDRAAQAASTNHDGILQTRSTASAVRVRLNRTQITASNYLNSGVPGTKASNAAQNCAR